MSHLEIELFGERDNVWGRSKLQVCMQCSYLMQGLQSYNCDKKKSVECNLCAHFALNKIGYKIWRAEYNFAVRVSEARGHMRAALL